MLDLLNKKLKRALRELNQNDAVLLENDASERSIAHMLSIYLKAEFPDYHVDNEYNLNIDNERDRKEIWEIKEKLFELNKTLYRRHQRIVDRENYYHLSVYPDIIIHERRSNSRNLLIIEIKKSSNNNVNALDFDDFKIKKYTGPYNQNEFKYAFGALITINVGAGRNDNHRSEFFHDGERTAI